MAKFTDEDDALLDELGVEVETKKDAGRTPREERIIAGFEEIQRFVEQHGRAPQHGEERDIFERLYAVRLDRLRALEDCRTLLEPLDHQELLAGASIRRRRAADDDRTTTNCWPQLGVDAAGARTTSRNSGMSVPPPTNARPRKSPTARSARTSTASSPSSMQVQNELDSGVRTDAVRCEL